MTKETGLPNCCYGDDYDSVFTGDEATTLARKYQRRGLGRSEAELLSLVKETNVPTPTMIEVGGGVGELQVSLLESRVVERATNVELSSSWEDAAMSLAAASGQRDRVTRIVGDFVDHAPELPAADLLVMHRVVCCYPDWQALVGAAAAKTRRLLAMTFPDDNWLARAFIGINNVIHRMKRVDFRAFVHPPDAMIELAKGAGFLVVADRRHLIWRTLLFERIRPG